MDVSPLLVPPLLLAAVLGLSGALKVPERQATRDAFVGLGLPGRVAASPAPLVLPYAELALAALLVVAGGRAGVVVAVATLALLGGHLALVARAVRLDEPPACACFGRLGLARVSQLTVARNAVLVGLAVLDLGRAAYGARSPLAELAGLDGLEWVWLAMVVAAVAVAALVVLPGAADPAPPPPDEDYLRHPIPYGMLTEPNGTMRSLREMSRNGAVLLVFLSYGCAPCMRLIEHLPVFDSANPEVSTVAVFGESQREHVDERVIGVPVLLDPEGAVATVFGSAAPSAVLLGADGLLAGGPVTGERDVIGLLSDIAAELAHSRAAVA